MQVSSGIRGFGIPLDHGQHILYSKAEHLLDVIQRTLACCLNGLPLPSLTLLDDAA